MLYLKQKVSTDVEDSQVCLWYCIVYGTINRYFTCFEAVNLEQTLTVQKNFVTVLKT